MVSFIHGDVKRPGPDSPDRPMACELESYCVGRLPGGRQPDRPPGETGRVEVPGRPDDLVVEDRGQPVLRPLRAHDLRGEPGRGAVGHRFAEDAPQELALVRDVEPEDASE